MENLLDYRGYAFTATIGTAEVKKGIIQVENGRVFLCQNERDGSDCQHKLGFRYSWVVGDGSKAMLIKNDVKNFKLGKKLRNLPPEKLKSLYGYSITKKGQGLDFGCGAVRVTKLTLSRLIDVLEKDMGGLNKAQALIDARIEKLQKEKTLIEAQKAQVFSKNPSLKSLSMNMKGHIGKDLSIVDLDTIKLLYKQYFTNEKE